MTEELSTRATAVTVFEDRAEVTRSTTLDRTCRRISLTGLSPYVDERSLRASASGSTRVLSARVRWRTRAGSAVSPDEVEGLRSAVTQARDAVADAKSAWERAGAEVARLNGLRDQWLTRLASAPAGLSDPERARAWGAAGGSIAAMLTPSQTARSCAAAAIDQRQRDLEAAKARLSAALSRAPEIEAVAEVELADAQAGTSVELVYRVPCALWRPEYTVRVPAEHDAGTTAPVEVVRYACVWQRTGEVWDSIRLTCSTARPGATASPPLLSDDVLAARKRTPDEQRRVDVELREEEVVVAAVAGVRSVDDMPGLADGGHPVHWAADEPVHIDSDGHPVRFEVGKTMVSAEIERVLVPQLASVAHLRSTGLLSGGQPLLAGPVRIVRGEAMVGRGTTGFVGSGERFELGLGTDDGVRCRREESVERDQSFTGQRIRHQVVVHVSNVSDSPRRLVVTERVPVSEIEAVQVRVAASGFDVDRDGIARRQLDLPPNATQTVELAYEVRAGNAVVLPA